MKKLSNLAILLILSGCSLIPQLKPVNPNPPVIPPPPPTTLPPIPPVVTPPPPPVVSQCPMEIPAEGRWINIKPYGQGYDSTPRVKNQAYCERMTGIGGVPDCKANPEGSGNDACDTAFLGAPCPIWEQSLDGKNWGRCLPTPADISCDHFEHWNERQPYTGNCQKNLEGSPVAGFFMIAHGKGFVRACNSDSTICSQSKAVDF